MLNWLVYYLLLAGFTLPGCLLARASFPGARSPFLVVAVGFVFSQAVFAVAAWPCLWLRCSLPTFWLALGPLWALYLLAAVRPGAAIVGAPVVSAPGRGVDSRPDPGTAAGHCARVPLTFALLAYLGWGGVIARYVSGSLTWRLNVSWDALVVLGVWFGLGVAWFPGLRRHYRESPTVDLNGDPPRLWAATALAGAALLATGAAFAARPDWDDAFYLNAVHQYVASGTLNFENPSFPGEGLPVAPHMRLLAWELWGATLCRFSGVDPSVSQHSLLPPVVVLLAFAAHWTLFERALLPRRLVPLAALVLCVCWLSGNVGYNTQGNYLLNRAWEGKTVLWAVALPVEVVVLWEFMKAPGPRAWLACALGATGALALSSSAVYLIAVLVPSFCLVVMVWGGLRVRPQALVAVGASAGAVVVYGLVLRSQLGTFPVIAARLEGHDWRLGVYQWAVEHGGSGAFWLVSLPILAAVVPSRPARAYLVALPLFLAVTVMNPLFYEQVAKNLTSYWTYHRLYWLCPGRVGLAAGAAAVAGFAGGTGAGTPGRRAVPLAVALGLAAGLTLLPGELAWSDAYHGPYPGLEHAWAENTSKVPGHLVPILDRMSSRSWGDGAVLFPEYLSPFFAPYRGSDLRFVCSRPSNTVEALGMAGRPEEGQERAGLAVKFFDFKGTSVGNLDRDHLLSTLSDRLAGMLLEKYHVAAVVNQRGRGGDDSRPGRLGFRLALENGGYQLWERSGGPRSAAGASPASVAGRPNAAGVGGPGR